MAATPVEGSRRVDAQRNRHRILVAAQEAFAEADSDVSMVEIARRAGIGSATLYRNFPDRLTLLEALYSDEIAAISDAATRSEGATPLARLQWWLRQFFAYFTNKQALAGELLQYVNPDSTVFSDGYTRISGAARPLVEAANASGELREGLTLEHIFGLVGTIATLHGPDSYRALMLDVALDGMRSPRS